MKIKKIISLILVFALTAPQLQVVTATEASSEPVWDGSTASSYQRGTGTLQDPFKIDNGAQLARLAQEVNNGNETDNHYVLTNNINLGNLEWTPIGSMQNPFLGVFDGNGYSIINMRINYTQQNFVEVNALLNDVHANSILFSDLETEASAVTSFTDIDQDGSESFELSNVKTGDVNQDGSESLELSNAETEDVDKDGSESLELFNAETEDVDQDDNELLELSDEPELISADIDKDDTEALELSKSKMMAEMADRYRNIDKDNPEAIEAFILEMIDINKVINQDVPELSEYAMLEMMKQCRQGDDGFTESDLSSGSRTITPFAASINQDYVGLFGYFAAGEIKNVVIQDSYVYGNGLFTGGVVGYSSEGTLMENCYNKGEVSASNGSVGGIAGCADGDITKCYNSGEIIAYDSAQYVGGIAGEASGNIRHSINAGTVDSSCWAQVGGIVGCFTSYKEIYACLNIGNVFSDINGFSGGIAGAMDNGYVMNCGNTGMVAGFGNGFQGGVAGEGTDISNSYNTGIVFGQFTAGISACLTDYASRNYNVGIIGGKYSQAGVISLLASGAGVGYNENFWLTGSASVGIDTKIGFGTVLSVSSTQLKEPTWIYQNLLDEFAPDEDNINKGYPILNRINYNPSFPNPPSPQTKSGSFNFQSKRKPDSPDQYKDYSATYYYNDDYFSKEASIYNQSLATMSLCFELSTFASNVGGQEDYSDKARNAHDLLEQIGFNPDYIETNEYFTVKPSEDSIGVIIAHKDIEVDGKEYTLIALATRGGGYEAEWAGNFTIGASGQHEGFKTASDEAYKFLGEYITRHKDEFQDDIKLWFAGYSRGGATVNLLAGRLNDEKQIAGIDFNKEDLYAYCFEPPMGVLISEVTPIDDYTNIHNIVNPNDPVTKVAPRDWGFYRYGEDRLLPTPTTSSNYRKESAAMLEKFKPLNTEWVNESITNVKGQEKHIVDTFQAKKFDPSVEIDVGHWEERIGWFGEEYSVWIPSFGVDTNLVANDNKDMSTFLDDLVLSFSVGMVDRVNYTEQLQQAARLAASEFMGKGYESYKWEKVPDILDQKLKEHVLDIAVALLWSGVDDAEKLVMEYVYDSAAEAGINLYAYESVPNATAEALRSVGRAVIASATLNGGNDLLTLASDGNSRKLFPAHYPELCLAWMQSQDVNYGGELKLFINSYRVVRINCPVDVSVYNSNNTLVAQIINDVPQKIEDSAIVASFNANSEKVVYLPADEDYYIKIAATADGELNYSLSEFSYDTGTYAKIVNYYDIPIITGDTIEGVVPKFLAQDTVNTGEGSSTRYTLSNKTGQLTPSKEILGESARAAVYSVSVTSDNTEAGMAVGGGVYSEGAFAQVTAIAYENYKFDGWYVNNALVSTDKIYRFRIEQDATVVAKFVEGEPNEPVEPGSDNKVKQISVGDQYTLALKEDGTVWSWGLNNYGQLGNGTKTNSMVPVQVIGLEDVTEISAGVNHNLALTSSGTVYAWGYNNYGRLGDGTISTRTTPIMVQGLVDIVAVSADGCHSLALKSDGTVYSWGFNNNGQLGHGDTENRYTPEVIEGLTDITKIAAGTNHSLALKSDGTVYTWGYNGSGQLGNGSSSSTVFGTTPEKVAALDGIIDIDAGTSFNLALSANGLVYAWGNNSSGQLGDNSVTTRKTPVLISGITDVATIVAGNSSSFAIKNDGALWGWGLNTSGQLGDGTTTNRLTPQQIANMQSVTGIDVYTHSAALKQDRTVWATGNNTSAQLGDGTTTSSPLHVRVTGLD